MNTVDLKSFQYLENGNVQFSILDTKEVRNTLKSGSYSVSAEWIGQRVEVKLTLLMDGESSRSCYHKNQELLDELFSKFFNKKIKKTINNLGFNHKIGILLSGKEGSGKTTILKNYCEKFIEDYEAIVFNIVGKPSYLQNIWDLIMDIRKIQNNPIIVVFDEFDKFVSEEALLKTILDGSLSIDNCLVFATTNYLDLIPVALKDRPSRFKYSFTFDGVTSRDFVKKTLTNMIGDLVTEHQINDYVEQLKNDTIDTIKQFCLDKIMDLDSTSIKKKSTIGFNNN